MASLRNRTVVVVGGTTGLGLSGAKALVNAGASLVVIGSEAKEAEEAGAALGDGVRILVSDARDPETAPRAIDLALATFGSFHGLYHVAGGSGRRWGDGPLHDLCDEGWDETLRLNLTSLFRSNRAAVRQFLAQGGGGCILNMGSVLGRSPSPHHFATHAYAAAKSAVEGFTRSIAAYYAPRDIRVNTLAPGLTDTPMARRATEDPAIRGFIGTKQPLDGGRFATPTDLDEAVVFFLGDGSRFVTGQVLAVDGGWSVSEGRII